MKIKSSQFFFVIVIILFVLVWVGLNFSFKQEAEPIYLAFIGPLSGDGAAAGKLMTQGIQLYLDTVNEKGGINGRKIMLDHFDDQNDRTQSRQQALEIVKQNRAVAVIGHWYSSASMSGGEIYKQYHIPALTPGSTNINVTLNNDWYFRNIFTAKSSGEFLAHYVKKVFKEDTVSIIHEEAAYGAYLAQVFEETALKLGSQIKYKRRFDSADPNLDQVLTRIVDELSSEKEAGVIFLAVQALEGIKLVKLMKEANLTNRIISETSFSEQTFIHGFEKFPREKINPGYYTNDIYVATPLLFDTANEDAQRFKDEYQAAYNEKPDWAAAYAVDSAMVLVEAIKQTAIAGQPETITEDRQKIRDYLANLNNIEKAIQGLTGFNYFDEQGDALKPISIGVFRNGNIISAATQLQVVPYINQLFNLEAELEKERILLIGDKYMYKTNVVYVGFELNEIIDIDFTKLTYTLDFYLWFRFQGDLETQNIEFINAVEPIALEPPKIEKLGDKTSHLYHIKAPFKSHFFANYYVYKQYELGVRFHHKELTRYNLIYVTDILGMGLTEDNALLETIQKKQILGPFFDWNISNFWFFQDTIQKSPLGSLQYINVPGRQIEYSRFNAAIKIKNSQFTLRGRVPLKLSANLALCSIMMLLLLRLADKFKRFFNAIWFLQAFFAFLFLLTSEVVLIELLAFESNTSHLKYIIVVFDLLWWVTPAYLVNLIVKRFLWAPLEEKTGQTIPNVVRLFVSFMVYLLAVFGIIAFVYDQALTSLLATSGVVAMIIGLAIQINIANIFSGIVINVERPFRVNDGIKIQMGKVFHEGKVVDITWRTTRLLTKDGYILSIPNNMASEAVIHNYNYTEDLCLASVNIRIDYAHPPERVEKILLDATLSTDDVLREPPPVCKFKGFTDWVADYSISFYVDDYAKKSACNDAVFKRVWVHLNRAGIVPPIKRQEIQSFQGIKSRSLDEASKPLALLQEMDIFQPFSDEHKAYLNERIRRHRFTVGETVVKQGEKGDSLFIIVEGVVSVHVELEKKKSLEVARLGAGNFFGEMALFTGQERTATIITMTDTILLEMIKDDIIPLMQKEPEVTQLISKILTQRQMKTQSQLNLHHSEIDKIYKRMLRGVGSFLGLKHPEK